MVVHNGNHNINSNAHKNIVFCDYIKHSNPTRSCHALLISTTSIEINGIFYF